MLWFLWIGYEDRGLTAVLVVGASLSLAIGVSLMARWIGGREMPALRWIAVAAGAGLVVGASVTWIAALLILMKTSLHTHPYLDFSPTDLRLLIERTPIWALAGLLIGSAFGLALVRRRATG